MSTESGDGAVVMNNAVVDYWYDHYVRDELCGLCGNLGVVDTRLSARSPTGLKVGGVFLCICPNGQTLRHHGVHPSQIVKPEDKLVVS